MAMLDTSLTTTQAAKHLKVDPSAFGSACVSVVCTESNMTGKSGCRCSSSKDESDSRTCARSRELPAQLSPLDVAEWFLSPDPDLEIEERVEPVSPRQWLLSGRPVERVVALARGFE